MEAGPQPPRPPQPPPQPKALTPQEAAASADPQERLEGVAAWVAQLDRKLATRFYALAAASVLALAAAIVAVVLALGVEDDSASKGELAELRDQIDEATRSASDVAEDSVADLEGRLSEIESQIEAIRSDQTSSSRELSVVQDDIADLRDQIAAVEQTAEDAAAAAASASSGPGDSGDETP